MLQRSPTTSLARAAVAAAATCALAAPALAQSASLPASSVDLAVPVSEAVYPSQDYGNSRQPNDDRFARTRWRVIEQTGNCCETFVTVTPDGRLLDYGGKYINYSDDRGQTWKSVRPVLPLVNGEGAIVVAPGGDVLGVQWDPYTGDHLQFYKYEGSTGEWLYTEMPVHVPFYDREWIAVVPGPIVLDGQTHEYVAFVKGAWPSKEVWFYSVDGLNYTRATSKQLELILSGGEQSGALPIEPGLDHDWIQANTNTLVTPLGAGYALAGPDLPFTTWGLFDGGAFGWSAFHFPEDVAPQGRFQVDSAGRLHNVVVAPDGTGFEYRSSTDGGLTWSVETVALPLDHVIEEWDFRAHLAAGVAAVAVHASNLAAGTDVDLVFKLDITKDPVLRRMYQVGLGDIDGTAGAGNSVRMDFQSIAIFADGRVAVSMMDSTTTNAAETSVDPGVAVELDTELGDKIPIVERIVPELGEALASFTFDEGADGWVASGVPTTWTRSAPGTKDGTDDETSTAYAFEGPVQYGNAVDVALTSPPVAVPAGLAVLEAWTRHHTEAGFDFVIAEWSADGATWQELGRLSGMNEGHPGWQKVTWGFEAPGGDVQVRFRFTSDIACSPLDICHDLVGARLDEVVVGTQKVAAPPPPAPVPPPDAGAPADDQPPAADDQGAAGCRVSAGAGAAPVGAILALAGLALVLLRRRR